jgi:hypothetical protein
MSYRIANPLHPPLQSLNSHGLTHTKKSHEQQKKLWILARSGQQLLSSKRMEKQPLSLLINLSALCIGTWPLGGSSSRTLRTGHTGSEGFCLWDLLCLQNRSGTFSHTRNTHVPEADKIPH